MATPPDPVTASGIPPRSVLRGHAPEGLGTPMVVSLPGHIAALAWDHGIPPVDLLHWIADAAAEEGVAGRGRSDYEAMFTDLLRKPRASLSGLSATARVVAAALDRLTGRSDTAATTALAWAPAIPTKAAFRRVRAWCPVCYLEWSAPQPMGEGTVPHPPLYEPLLWQFEPLAVCATHAVYLRTSCPDAACGARRGALAAWAQPGFCACGTFLGEPRDAIVARDGAPTDDELAWGAFVTDALGALITEAPRHDEDVARADIAAAVQIAVDQTHDGTYTPFAAAVRMSLGTVSLWKDGRRRPTLWGALRICAVAGFRLPDFLAGRLDALRAATPPAVVPPVPPSTETHEVHDPALVRAALEAALTAAAPPSLAAVNRTLHISDRQLMRTYPDLCPAIVDRYRGWIEERGQAARAERERLVLEAITAVAATGAYPSRGRVQDLLPSRISLRRAALEEVWKDAVVRLGYPRPDLPARPGRGRG